MENIMKNMIYLILYIFILCSSCSKNTTEPDEKEKTSSSVLVDVRAMIGDKLWITTSTQKTDHPRGLVEIDMKIFDETTNEYVMEKTKTTNADGFVFFDSLSIGKYLFVPKKTDEILEVVLKNLEIFTDNTQDTVLVGVGYNWNFSSYNFDVSIDTSSIFEFGEYQALILNSGLRDTLYCTFDTSLVPEWIDIEFSTNVFPTTVSSIWDYYVYLQYKFSEVPLEILPFTFTVDVHHQFDISTFNFNVAIKEE
jgi:hypothetical protein